MWAGSWRHCRASVAFSRTRGRELASARQPTPAERLQGGMMATGAKWQGAWHLPLASCTRVQTLHFARRARALLQGRQIVYKLA